MSPLPSVKKTVAAGLAVVLLPCAACTQEKEAAPTPRPEATETSGARLAPSLKDYATTLLQDLTSSGQDVSDNQRAILKKASEGDGTVTAADYESVWNDYRQCIKDKGYTDALITVYPDGYHDVGQTDASALAQAQTGKLSEDCMSCFTYYIGDIERFTGCSWGTRHCSPTPRRPSSTASTRTD